MDRDSIYNNLVRIFCPCEECFPYLYFEEHEKNQQNQVKLLFFKATIFSFTGIEISVYLHDLFF